MGFTFLKKLPTPAEIRNQYPIDTAIQELRQKEIRKSVMFLPENPINFLPSSDLVLQTTKMLYVTIFSVSAKFRKKLRIKF